MNSSSFLSGRNIGLDFLRALLILLGVLLHAARSLPGENGWYYVSQRSESHLFNALIALIHTFRMEVFFFLSGMFSALIILKKGRKFFLENRKGRVLIPLISAYVFIPPLMYLISSEIHQRAMTTAGVTGSYTMLHHLWFLVSLSVISFLIPGSFYTQVAALFRRMPLPLLVVTLILLTDACFAVKYFVKGRGEFMELIPVTARFMIYYAAGYALYANKDKISTYTRSLLLKSWLITALALLTLLGFYTVFHLNINGIMKYIPVLIGSVFSVLFSYWIVFKFEQIKIKESPVLRSIVNSALVVYILHYPLVITFAWLTDAWLPANLSVTYVMIVTLLGLAFSAALYAVIKQSELLSIMFGLKLSAAKVIPPLNTPDLKI